MRNLFEKECDSILSKDSRYFIFPYPNEIKKEIVSIGLEDINANIKSLRSYQKNKAEWKIEILKEFKLIDYFDKKFDEFYNQYFNYRKQFLAEVIIEVSKENSIKKHNLREKMDKNLVDIDKDYKMIGSILQNPDELKNILIQIANSIIIKEKVSLKTSESESENQSEVEFSFSDFLNIIIFIAALIGGGYFFCNKSKFTSNNHKRSNPYQESNVYTDKRRENSNSYGYTKKTEKEKPKTYRDNRKYSFE
ncbi:MAG: hypothetical protein KC550_04990 [Nanoarchaeota archaeon]|nr:hypothetical protein [Nanoarchaeota archaeon]